MDSRPARHRFSSGFPELDAVYDRASEDLFHSPWRTPFVYRFVPDDGGPACDAPPPGVPGCHHLILGDQYRFERRPDSPRIALWVRQGQSWVKAHDEIFAFSASVYAARDRGALLSRVSPVFWPITQASPQDSLVQFMTARRALWSTLVAPLSAARPELFCPRTVPPSVREPKGYKVVSHADRALMVLSRQQDRARATHAQANYKAAMRDWWAHFVDRRILAQLVSVVGASRRTVLDFASYAAFTRHPDLDALLAGLPAMGEQRRVLATAPWSQWNAEGLSAVLGPAWPVALRHRVAALPVPMQRALVPAMTTLNERVDFSLARWVGALEALARERLSPRQQDMATQALIEAVALAYAEREESKARFPGLGSPSIEITERLRRASVRSHLEDAGLAGRMVDLVSAWRLAFPDAYLRFSALDRSEFASDVRTLLIESPPGSWRVDAQQNREVDTWLSTDRRTVLRAALVKQGLEKGLPRRGRGRPRKDAPAQLPARSAPARPRPAM